MEVGRAHASARTGVRIGITHRSVAWRRRWSMAVAALGALLGVAVAVPGSAFAAGSTGLLGSVTSPLSGSTGLYLVTDTSAATASAAAFDATGVGGQVVQSNDTEQTVAAVLNSAEVSALSAMPGVQVTPNVGIAVQDTGTTTSTRAPAAV